MTPVVEAWLVACVALLAATVFAIGRKEAQLVAARGSARPAGKESAL